MANPGAAGAANDGAAKLGSIFKPMLDEVKADLKNTVTVSTQELLIAITRLEARIDVLEKLVGEKKKSVSRADKKTEGDAAAAVADPNAAPAVQAPAGAKVAFPNNKMVYFRKQYKDDPAYRAKYVTEELAKAMAADNTIAGKASEDQKRAAEATFCWNWIKDNDKKTAEAIEKEFAAAKAAHEAANKPPQQVAEAHTPQ